MDRYRHIAAWIFLLSVPLAAWGMKTSCDSIRIGEENWLLTEKPISADNGLRDRLIAFFPEGRILYANDWDSYTGYWTLSNDSLYLQKLEIYLFDEAKQKEYIRTFSAKTLGRIFPSYATRKGICARWFSGKLVAGKGETLRFDSLSPSRNLEQERVLDVSRGKVTRNVLYHNYKKRGTSLQSAQPEISRRFPWERFPEIKGKKLIFTIDDCRMDAYGNFVDCRAAAAVRPSQTTLKDQSHPLIKAFKETLRSIRSWEIFFIQGKYMMEFSRYVVFLRNSQEDSRAGLSDGTAPEKK